jgi:hypothetical protein
MMNDLTWWSSLSASNTISVYLVKALPPSTVAAKAITIFMVNLISKQNLQNPVMTFSFKWELKECNLRASYISLIWAA